MQMRCAIARSGPMPPQSPKPLAQPVEYRPAHCAWRSAAPVAWATRLRSAAQFGQTPVKHRSNTGQTHGANTAQVAWVTRFHHWSNTGHTHFKTGQTPVKHRPNTGRTARRWRGSPAPGRRSWRRRSPSAPRARPSCTRPSPSGSGPPPIRPSQTLVKHRSCTGQTLVKHWSNTGQTRVMCWSTIMYPAFAKWIRSAPNIP
jgi:hypothetical protein